MSNPAPKRKVKKKWLIVVLGGLLGALGIAEEVGLTPPVLTELVGQVLDAALPPDDQPQAE